MTPYFQLMMKIAQEDVGVVEEKDKQYGSSWAKRGGVGAYMMLARKWDRLEEFVQQKHDYNVFKAIASDQRDEGVLDDIRDLRRYLLLVETQMVTYLKRPINAAENAKAHPVPQPGDMVYSDADTRRMEREAAHHAGQDYRPAITEQEMREIIGRNTLLAHPGASDGPVSTGVPVGPSTGLTGGRAHTVSVGSFPTRSVPRGGFGPRGFDPAQDV